MKPSLIQTQAKVNSLAAPLVANSNLVSSYSTSDDTLSGAYNLGTILNTTASTTMTRTLGGTLSNTDLVDYYRFTSFNNFNFDVKLSNMSGNADLRLIRDSNGNGSIDREDVIIGSYTASNNPESLLIQGLGGDTYFLEVKSADRSTTDHNLKLSASVGSALEPTNTDSNSIRTVIDIAGQLNGNRYFKENVNAVGDANDYYHFRLDQATDLMPFYCQNLLMPMYFCIWMPTQTGLLRAEK